MVGFALENTQLFNTKKRVPYKIILEFVDYEEFRQFNFQFQNDKDYKITNDEIIKLKNFNVDKEWEIQDEQNNVQEDNKKLEEYYDFISIKFQEEEENSSKRLTRDNLSHYKLSVIKQQQSYSIEEQVKKYQSSSKKKTKRKKSFELKRLKSTSQSQKKIYQKTKSQIYENFDDLRFKRKRANFLEEQFDKKKIQNVDLLVKINQEISQIEKDIDSDTPIKMITMMEEENQKQKFFGEELQEVQIKIKNQSPFKTFKTYSIKAIILKGGDDLRQEMVAMQIIKLFKNIFDRENTHLYLKPYEIQAINKDSGFLEFLDNTTTIDHLKKKLNVSLLQIYYDLFSNQEFDIARKNFIDSLAAYSLLIYFVQIKDRHNGNILISQDGHLLHIDFGFLFTTSPGKINFENLMEGTDSCYFSYFKNQLLKGIQALKKNLDDIITLLEMISHRSVLPCFKTFQMSEFVERFQPFKNEEETRDYINYLVEESLLNKRTYWYDEFQKLTNGIEP